MIKIALLLTLSLVSTAHAVRDPKKCGRVVVKRAEEQHRLGFRVVRLPEDCTSVELPVGYDGKPGVAGSEIWHNGVRLAWAIDTKQMPITDLSPLKSEIARQYVIPKNPRKIRRTVTKQYWQKDTYVTVTEEFEL